MMVSNVNKNAKVRKYVAANHRSLTNQALATVSILSLTACGGGGGNGGGADAAPTTPAPPPPPANTPTQIQNFTETSNNVFVATNAGGVLRSQNTSDDLTVTGGAGNDSIFTGSGNDTVTAGAGSDGVGTSAGIDFLDGGDGDQDYLYVQDTTEGVNINFLTGVHSGGTVEGDTIVNFEHVWLSPMDDVFVGDDNANIVEVRSGNDNISTGGGNDNIRGGAGNDTIDAGTGVDTIAYLYSEEGVTVNLTTNVNAGGHAAGDSLLNFENITATDFDDNLTGNASDNYIVAKDGDDIVNGEGGNDTLQGDSGDDVVSGGDGDDQIWDGLGTDIYNGDDGDDTFIIRDITFSHVTDQFDGGDGTDTLSYITWDDPNPFIVDMSLIDATNIEIIDLNNFLDTSDLTITLQDVIDITDADDQLFIKGGTDDSVTSTGQGWVQGADQVIDGVTYNSYTSGAGTLLIDEDITQTIS